MLIGPSSVTRPTSNLPFFCGCNTHTARHNSSPPCCSAELIIGVDIVYRRRNAKKLRHCLLRLLSPGGLAVLAVLAIGETVILLHPPRPFSRCFNTDGKGVSAK